MKFALFIHFIVLLFFFSCSNDETAIQPSIEEKPKTPFLIATDNEHAAAVSLMETTSNGLAVTGIATDQSSFYPFFAILDKDLHTNTYESRLGESGDFSSNILEAGGSFFFITYNIPSTLVYELEGFGITKVNAEGQRIWRKDYFHNISNDIRNELQLYQGKIYVLGNFITDHNSFVAKFDYDGNILDTVKFEDYHYTSNLTVNSGISFFGSTSEYGKFNGTYDWKYTPYIVKSDINGNIIWRTALLPSYDDPSFADVAVDSQGNFTVVHTEKVLEVSVYRRNFHVSRISATGELLWTKMLTNSLPDTDYLKLGAIQTNSAGEIFILLMQETQYVKKPLLLKYDPSGTLTKHLFHRSLENIIVTDMIIDYEGMLVIIGSKPEEKENYIIKVDQDLNLK